MQSKSQWSTHAVVFINPLMVVVTKGHTHTETDLHTNLLLPQAVKE